MICDCHLHTEFSGDSNTPVRLQIEKAIGLGMKELCITDHHDYDSGFCDDNFILDVPAYLEALRKLKEEYKNRIRLNIGIELGLQAHLHAYLHQFIARYGSSFDFIIGSSHFVKRMDPYDSEFW
ncbi:MAG: histidinol-phosphatase HisJ family protein, partial [Clostridiales bacterium]|nr:histidinol-phosphatase HisJ family protein [Clostridiales bacterium]